MNNEVTQNRPRPNKILIITCIVFHTVSLLFIGEAHEVLSGTTEAPSIVVIGCEDSAAKGTRPNISSARASETKTPRPSQ